MSSLLLLVDLQRDYLRAPGLEPASGTVVRNAARLLAAWREREQPVVHVWTTVSRTDDRRMPHWKREGRWICEDGTPGHAPPPALAPREGEAIVHKTSFSGFANGSLEQALGGVERLVVAGVHVHACVRQAVLDAYERHELEILVAEDATASDDPLHGAITRRYLERRAARFVPAAELLAELGPEEPPAAADPREAAARAAARCSGAKADWSSLDVARRAAALAAAADLLEQRQRSLADEIVAAVGKPILYAGPEVARSAAMLRAIAARASSAGGAEPAGGAEVRRRPLGTVAVITPWNNPVYIALGKIAAALVYGNAVVWKPAPAVTGLSRRIAGLLGEAGLPAGALELLPGGRLEAEAAMQDPAVDAVTLTGSSLAGFAAQEICGRRRIPLQAELGGNNAAIVWSDADLGLAARELADGAFAQAGQRCTANRRVVVERSCRSELLERLERETAELAWGDPRSCETRVGPLLDASQRDRVADLVARAEPDLGPATVPHGSGQPDVDGLDGRWYPPTILACEDPEHELVQHESFGPLLVVQSAGDWDHALELLNGVPQGLAAALFSSSEARAESFLAEARAGILKLGRSTADAEVDVPFGGWGASGIGPPEHGSFDRDFFTRPQAVYR